MNSTDKRAKLNKSVRDLLPMIQIGRVSSTRELESENSIKLQDITKPRSKLTNRQEFSGTKSELNVKRSTEFKLKPISKFVSPKEIIEVPSFPKKVSNIIQRKKVIRLATNMSINENYKSVIDNL
jgi:hypothetical protein